MNNRQKLKRFKKLKLYEIKYNKKELELGRKQMEEATTRLFENALSEEIGEYKGFKTAIKIDTENNILIGKISNISDSLNFCGDDVNEIKEMFHQSVDNYLELCLKIGKEPEK